MSYLVSHKLGVVVAVMNLLVLPCIRCWDEGVFLVIKKL